MAIAAWLCAGRSCQVRIVEPHIARLPDKLARFPRRRLVGLEEALEEADVVALLTRHRGLRRHREGRCRRERFRSTERAWSPGGEKTRNGGDRRQKGTARDPRPGPCQGAPGEYRERISGCWRERPRGPGSGKRHREPPRDPGVPLHGLEAIAEEGRRAGAAKRRSCGRPSWRKDDTPDPAVVSTPSSGSGKTRAPADFLVLLQPTAPLRRGRHVDEALDLLVSGQARSVVSVTPVPGHHHPAWQFSIRDGSLVPFLEHPSIPPRRQDSPPPTPGTGPSTPPGRKTGFPGRSPTARAVSPTSWRRKNGQYRRPGGPGRGGIPLPGGETGSEPLHGRNALQTRPFPGATRNPSAFGKATRPGGEPCLPRRTSSVKREHGGIDLSSRTRTGPASGNASRRGPWCAPSRTSGNGETASSCTGRSIPPRTCSSCPGPMEAWS